VRASFKVLVWLAGVTLLEVIIAAVFFGAFHEVGDVSDTRKHTYDVIMRGNAVMSEIKDAETGARGYALSDDIAFLRPYTASHADIVIRLQALRAMVRTPEARQRLDNVAPLVAARLAQLAKVVELRQRDDTAAMLTEITGGTGMRLMAKIRTGLNEFVQAELVLLAKIESEFQSNMQFLSAIIVAACLLTMLFAVVFAFLLNREIQYDLENKVFAETKHMLQAQEETNLALSLANATLQVSEERLQVTLNSIGDAVIATDADGLVTVLNPLGEQLTGWAKRDAVGRPVNEIFHIINQATRLPVPIPVRQTLAQGTTQSLKNHTLLISRGGTECAIADSCAPIRGHDGEVIGSILVFRDVTADDTASRAMRDSNALIQAILNTVVDGIITVQVGSGIVERANSAAEKMFGYPPSGLSGINFEMLIPEVPRRRVSDPVDFFSAMDAARAAGLGREVVGVRADGSSFPLEIAVGELWLGGNRYFTSIVRDITAKKRAESEQLKLDQRLRDQQFYSRSLIESNIDAIMTTDPSGIITDVNKQTEILTGCTRDELIGAPFKNCFTDSARAEAAIKRVVVEKTVSDFELTARHRDGKETVVSYNATTFYDRDRNLQGVFAAARDVTERKRLDFALKETNTALESAKFVAEKANLAKSDFLSSMSHELRSPLNAILGFAQLMDSDDPAPSESQRASIGQILHAGRYLLQLINEILDLAVIESGELSLSQEPVALDDVMLECRSMIETTAQQRGIAMHFPNFDESIFVRADRTRLKQALINLLSNAIKYNRPNGAVSVTCTHPTAARTRINVRDDGAGLSPDQLVQLFQPFNRLGQESSGIEGTGIGLVMSKRIVHAMGGSIGVESTVGTGSVFWVEFDSVEPPKLAGLKPLPASISGKHYQVRPVSKLLYIEDNPANLALIEQLIRRRPDMRLLTATNADAGIALARSEQPSLILMDINLPGMNGTQAMKVLANDPSTSHIPVMALSANAMPDDIKRGLEDGFVRYLTKPIDVDEFMDSLDWALQPA